MASTDTGRSILFVTVTVRWRPSIRITGARIYKAHLPGEMVRGATFDAEGFAPTVAAAASKPPNMLGNR